MNCNKIGNLKKLNDEDVNLHSFEGCYIGKIVSVYDGDTITAIIDYDNKYIKLKIRMLGYDSPEIKTKNALEKQYAEHSKKVLEKLILNKIVKIVCSNIKDKYGRVLATIYTKMNNEIMNVNTFMIENNLGYPYNGKTKPAFDELKITYYTNLKKYDVETRDFYEPTPCIIL